MIAWVIKRNGNGGYVQVPGTGAGSVGPLKTALLFRTKKEAQEDIVEHLTQGEEQVVKVNIEEVK